MKCPRDTQVPQPSPRSRAAARSASESAAPISAYASSRGSHLRRESAVPARFASRPSQPAAPLNSPHTTSASQQAHRGFPSASSGPPSTNQPTQSQSVSLSTRPRRRTGGDRLLDVRLNLILAAEPRGLLHHYAIAVNIERHRQVVQPAVGLLHLPVCQQNRIGDPGLLYDLRNRILAGIHVICHAENFKTLSRVLLLKLLKPRHLDLARSAPRRPEIHQHRPSLEVAQGYLLAIQRLQRESGRHLTQHVRRANVVRNRGSRGISRLGGCQDDVAGLSLLHRLPPFAQIMPTRPQQQRNPQHHHPKNQYVSLHVQHPSGALRLLNSIWIR